MKRVYFATIFVFYVLLCNAQTMDFNKFQKLFNLKSADNFQRSNFAAI